ncbi:MAG: FecR domain-containing protein [Bacteroidota bacterium]
MDNERTVVIGLMVKKLAREIDEEELAQLDQYLLNREYKQLADWMETQWLTYPDSQTLARSFDMNTELERLHQKLAETPIRELALPTASRNARFRYLAVACAVLLLAVAGGLWWSNQEGAGLTPIAEQSSATEVVPELIVASIGSKGRKVVLADGTAVWLNAGSELSVLPTFHEVERRVILNGEAFFEVATDSTRPFIVETGEIETRVLGTSFNVSAYQGEAMAVSVTEGKVNVLDQATHNVILTPNRQVVIDEEQDKWEEREIIAARFSSWKDGIFWFNNSSLSQVVPRLERRFNVRILFSDAQTSDCVLGGKIRTEDIAQVLYSLQTLYAIDYTYNAENQSITLGGGSCQ